MKTTFKEWNIWIYISVIINGMIFYLTWPETIFILIALPMYAIGLSIVLLMIHSFKEFNKMNNEKFVLKEEKE